MKTIGLLGGMSWESTDLYYQQINKMVQMKLGKLHSAKVVLISVDFAEIEELQHKGLWDEAGLYLKDKAIQLEKGGADGIVLCTNTMHKVASYIENSTTIPFIHIADATATEILSQNIKKIGPKIVIFTRGTKGSIAYDGNNFFEFGIFDCKVIDSMGAGDSYIAGFLMSLLNGVSIEGCMKNGALSSSITLGYKGAW